jgi:hypothetical protein
VSLAAFFYFQEMIMGEGIRQYFNPGDGCIYFFDKKKGCYRKICDIVSFADLPQAVKLQIKADQEEARETLALPVE